MVEVQVEVAVEVARAVAREVVVAAAAAAVIRERISVRGGEPSSNEREMERCALLSLSVAPRLSPVPCVHHEVYSAAMGGGQYTYAYSDCGMCGCTRRVRVGTVGSLSLSPLFTGREVLCLGSVYVRVAARGLR